MFSHMFSVCLGEGAFHYLVNHIESLWAMYGYATLCILLDLKQLARIWKNTTKESHKSMPHYEIEAMLYDAEG